MFASVELSSYRDQHFKVSTSEGATADLRLNKPIAGLALRARAIAPRLVYTLRGKLELLHQAMFVWLWWAWTSIRRRPAASASWAYHWHTKV